MANQDQTERTESKAPYIIICNGRIGVQTALARDELDLAIVHTSKTAASLVMFYELKNRQLPAATVKQISDNQHWFMQVYGEDGDPELIATEIKARITAMFTLFDELEKAVKS